MMKWLGQPVTARVRRAVMIGLRAGAENLLTESIKTAPKDEGTLIQSATVSTDDAQLKAAVAYDTPYAVRLHENPQFNFQNGRRGKWLKLTLDEKRDAIKRLIADKIRAALGL